MMMIQFTFLNRGVTGFYPSSYSFWSYSHMNCCLKNILYINLHILYIIHIKASSIIQESRKSNRYIKGYQQNMIEFLDKFLSMCISFQFQV